MRRNGKKTILILLLAAVWLLGGFAAAEETAEIAHETVPPDIPRVIDRVTDPEAEGLFQFPADARLLHIWFPNIMNADEAILIYGGDAWLIDCGDERMGTRGAELISRLGIERIGKLFNSHPHHDHLNGLKVTNRTAKVEELLICYPENATRHMKAAMKYAKANGIPVTTFTDGSEFRMGDGAVTLTFRLPVDPEVKLDVNNRSALTMIRYGERTILFTADMEQPGQKEMLKRVPPEEFRADLLKYPHHGKSAMDADFFEAVSPVAAIVTNKAVPSWRGVKFLKKNKVPVIYTNQSGVYIHLVTDGQTWIAEKVPRDRPESATGFSAVP